MKLFELELSDLLAIGCYVGQEVFLQMRRDWVFVYDSTTQKFIGKIRLRKTRLDGQAA